MFKKWILTVIVACFLVISTTFAYAEEQFPVADPEILTVEDVIIDKTDKNAVTARKRAITEAKRSAFGRLAKSMLPTKEFVDYKIPSDDVISGFVMDFEIKDEKLSSSRYKANFTVRFTGETGKFIKSGNSMFNRLFSESRRKKFFGGSPDKEFKTVLLLPYHKNYLGRKTLWEDPNPWRDEWQSLGGVMVSSKVSIIVPTGDINDMSFGNPMAVWSGDYSVLDKLIEYYNADEIMVAVADLGRRKIDIEIYSYYNGILDYKRPMKTSIADGGFKNAVSSIVSDKELFEDSIYTHNATGQDFVLEINMFFNSPQEWLGARKRIVSIKPAPVINIMSLNSDSVKFNIKVSSEERFYSLLKAFDKRRLNLIPSNFTQNPDEDLDTVRRNYILRLDY